MSTAAIVTAVPEWATIASREEFARVAVHDSTLALWLLQLFLAVVVLTGLILAAQVAEIIAERASRRSGLGGTGPAAVA